MYDAPQPEDNVIAHTAVARSLRVGEGKNTITIEFRHDVKFF